jgi:Domain of unknown function (DUF1824)
MTIYLTDARSIAARALLLACQSPQVAATTNPAEIRQALLTLLPEIDRLMLGICADDWEQGIQALQQYSQALNLPLLLPTPALSGAIYIKFNPSSPSCYASAYLGSDRGVLVAAQSDDLTKLNEMFGHLPLDLFAEVE